MMTVGPSSVPMSCAPSLVSGLPAAAGFVDGAAALVDAVGFDSAGVEPTADAGTAVGFAAGAVVGAAPDPADGGVVGAVGAQAATRLTPATASPPAPSF